MPETAGLELRERDIQRLVTDWLAIKGVWFLRLNTGAFAGEHKGRKRFVKFGKPGMADILCRVNKCGCHGVMPLGDECPAGREMIYTGWIEVKAQRGRQSPEQKRFEEEVKAAGMFYILAHDLEEVESRLREI